MHMIPPGYTLRPVTLVDKPANIPQESVLAGTALGVFTPADEVVSWVEATPLPTVTSRHGVMLVGIETREGYRRQGLAKAALAELTRHVIARCNVPLYACAHVNDASQRTALACGYRLYGETLRVQV
jgi:predicted GNAT family acetyltransferase